MSKGTVLDLFVIMILLFASAIGIIIAYKVLTAVTGSWTPTSATAQGILSSGGTMIKTFNYGFLIYAVGLTIAAVLGAYLIHSHPIFFWISILIVGLVLIVSPRFSNAWNVFIHNDDVATLGNEFPIMVTIMENLPKFLLGIGALITLAMYAKLNMGGGY